MRHPLNDGKVVEGNYIKKFFIKQITYSPVESLFVICTIFLWFRFYSGVIYETDSLNFLFASPTCPISVYFDHKIKNFVKLCCKLKNENLDTIKKGF